MSITKSCDQDFEQLNSFINNYGDVMPRDNDIFTQEFNGLCIGVRNGNLLVRDQEDCVYEIDASQFRQS